MKCALCKKTISNYNADFNNLKINEIDSADFCQECIDKFIKWQQNLFVRLFPTKTLKKIYKK